MADLDPMNDPAVSSVLKDEIERKSKKVLSSFLPACYGHIHTPLSVGLLPSIPSHLLFPGH